jgi:hypothetical protein
MNTATLTNNTIRVYGEQSGPHHSVFTFNTSTNTLTINPDSDFFIGETIGVIVTKGAKSISNDSLSFPLIWQFGIDVTYATTSYVLDTLITAGPTSSGVIFCDFDNDGDPDAANSSHDEGVVRIYRNLGAGRFSTLQVLTGGGLSWGVYCSSSGDFNTDGFIDLAIPSRFGNVISIWFNNGNGTFTHVQQVPVNSEPQQSIPGDFNGDGFLDLAVCCNNAATYYYDILINDGTGHFSGSQQIPIPERPDYGTMGDVDNDGDLDLVISDTPTPSVSSVYLLINNGNAVFTLTLIPILSTGNFPTFGDVDNDGDLDIITNGSAVGPNWGMKVLKNNGSGDFTESQAFGTSDTYYILKGFVDINNDGFLDMSTINVTNQYQRDIFYNNGSGSFTFAYTIPNWNNSAPYGFGVDIDKDGDMDMGGGNNGSFAVYYGISPLPPPPAPALVSPGNGSSCVSLTALLDWSDVTAATSYSVQVATDAAFTTIIINITGITTSQYAVTSGLTNNTLYYWRAASVNSGGTTWSSAWSFTTSTLSLPSAPTLLTPANGVIGQSLTPTLDWADLTGAATYKAEISTSNVFTTITDSATVSISQYTVPAGKLSIGTLYYWRVFGKNTCNISPASTVWNFTTAVNPPSAPTLVSPANGAGCQSLNLTLDWSDIPGATSYNVQVSFVPTFATMVVNESNLTSSQYTVPSNLVNNSQFYWRVNSSNSGGTSAWSAVWSFTTTTAALPVPPVLSTPVNGVTGQSLTPKLVWFKLNEASLYRIQISTDNLFSTITDSSTVTDSFYTIPSGKLTNHVIYYWRVFGINTCNISSASLVWNFETYYLGIIQNSNEIPKEFKLYNNYPNPFNPVTSISFDIPTKSFVSLKIWDLLGKEIMTLVYNDLSPGKYEYILNASGLSSGMYIYKLKANEYISIKKMVLIK